MKALATRANLTGRRAQKLRTEKRPITKPGTRSTEAAGSRQVGQRYTDRWRFCMRYWSSNDTGRVSDARTIWGRSTYTWMGPSHEVP